MRGLERKLVITVGLGALVALAGCPKGSGKSTIVLRGSAKVSFPGDSPGRTISVKLTPNPKGGLDVDTGVDRGSAFHGAAWTAALVATSAAGQPLADVTFTIKGSGGDEPETAAMVAVLALAAAKKHALKPKTTLIATLNLDGTLAPVRNLAGRIGAATQQGFKTIGYPAGQKMAGDVDVEALAAKAGAKAVPVGALHEGYQLLTGHVLASPSPVDVADMAVPRDAAALKKGLSQWKTVYGLLARSVKVAVKSGQISPEAARRLKVSERFLEASSRLTGEGNLAAGYEYSARAVSWVFTLLRSQSILAVAKSAFISGKWDAIAARADQLFKAAQPARIAYERLQRAPQPRSIDAVLARIAAFGLAVEARAYLSAVDPLYQTAKTFKKPPEEAPGKVKAFNGLTGHIERAVRYMGVARGKASKAYVLSDLGAAGSGWTIRRTRLSQIAARFTAAANANLNTADSLLAQRSRKQNIPVKRLRLLVTNYLVARGAANQAAKLAKRNVKTGPIWPRLAQLGAAVSSYLNSQMLITKLVTLGAYADMGRTVKKVARAGALKELVAAVQIRARTAAQHAKAATGSIPLASRYYFSIGEAMAATKEFSLQVKALEMYWRSHLLSEIAGLLPADD